jgi:hypothetical protein
MRHSVDVARVELLKRAELDVDEVPCLDREQKIVDDKTTAWEALRGGRQDVGLPPGGSGRRRAALILGSVDPDPRGGDYRGEGSEKIVEWPVDLFTGVGSFMRGRNSQGSGVGWAGMAPNHTFAR